MTTAIHWTKKDDEALKRLIKAGYSAGRCARHFNSDPTLRFVSRNACIGRAGRLGLLFCSNIKNRPPQVNAWLEWEDITLKTMCMAGKSPQQSAEKLGRTVAACRHRAAALKVSFTDHVVVFPHQRGDDKRIFTAHEAKPGDKPVTIEELNARSCRWPLDVDGQHVGYCGVTKENNEYCRFHAEIAYPALARLVQGKKQEVA